MNPRLLSSLVLLAILTACGQAGLTQSPAPSGSTVTIAPSGAAPASGAGDHTDPELEALLPDQVGGLPLIKTSRSGEDVLEGSPPEGPLALMLTGVGAEASALSTATAFSADDEFGIVAHRVEGVSAEELLQVFVEDMEAFTATSEEEIAGKPVVGAPDGSFYVYGSEEALFTIHANPPNASLVEEALSQLP